MSPDWTPQSWRSHEAIQMPDYPDQTALAEVEKELGGLESLQERYLYRYGLRNAHQVVVQTEVQRIALGNKLAIEGEVLAMARPGPADP